MQASQEAAEGWSASGRVDRGRDESAVEDKRSSRKNAVSTASIPALAQMLVGVDVGLDPWPAFTALSLPLARRVEWRGRLGLGPSSRLVVRGSQKIPWHGKSLPGLKQFNPNLEMVLCD